MKKILLASVAIVAALAVFTGTSTFAQNQQVPTPSTGIVSASAGLTPASPFYFLDRLSEIIREFFTFNPEAKVKLKVEFANERIAEIKIMMGDKEVNTGDVEEAKSLLVADISDAQNIVDKEKLDDNDISEFTTSLDDEANTDDEDMKQTFEDIKTEIDDSQNEIDNQDKIDTEENQKESDVEDVKNNEDSKDVQRQGERGDSSED